MKTLLFLGIAFFGFKGHAAIETVSGKVIGIESGYVRVVKNGSVRLAPRPKQVSHGQQVSITFNSEDFKKQLKKF